jgi:hypothetical protein
MKIVGLPLLLPGLLALAAPALANPHGGSGAVPASYPTKAEAEKAAKVHFNCTGAHRMGSRWMPCAQHSNTLPAPGNPH